MAYMETIDQGITARISLGFQVQEKLNLLMHAAYFNGMKDRDLSEWLSPPPEEYNRSIFFSVGIERKL